MKNALYQLLVLVSLLLTSFSFADECKDLLRGETKNRLYSSNKLDYRLARHYQFCDTAKRYDLNTDEYDRFAEDYANHARVTKGKGNVEVFGLFELGGSGHHQTDNTAKKTNWLKKNKRIIRDYYRDHCSDDNVDTATKSEDVFLLELAQEGTVQAWRDCMVRRLSGNTLFAYLVKDENADPSDETATFGINLKWHAQDEVRVNSIQIEASSNIVIYTDLRLGLMERMEACFLNYFYPNQNQEDRVCTRNVLSSPLLVGNSKVISIKQLDRKAGDVVIHYTNSLGGQYSIPLQIPRRILPEAPNLDILPEKFNALYDLSVRWQDDKGAPSDGVDGFRWHSKDLNEGHGGKYIYCGYKVDKEKPPITEVGFCTFPDRGTPSEDLIRDAMRARGLTNYSTVDINKGAGGKFIYLGWAKDQPGKPAITAITFEETSSNHPYPRHKDGWTAIHQDLCEGAGGSYLWCYYQSKERN